MTTNPGAAACLRRAAFRGDGSRGSGENAGSRETEGTSAWVRIPYTGVGDTRKVYCWKGRHQGKGRTSRGPRSRNQPACDFCKTHDRKRRKRWKTQQNQVQDHVAGTRRDDGKHHVQSNRHDGRRQAMNVPTSKIYAGDVVPGDVLAEHMWLCTNVSITKCNASITWLTDTGP